MPAHRTKDQQLDLSRRAHAALEAARIGEAGFHAAAASFLFTELDVALTFAEVCRQLSRSSADPASIEHSAHDAENALLGALQTHKWVKFDADMLKRLRQKVETLEALFGLIAKNLSKSRTKSIKKYLRCLRALAS